MGSAGGRAEGAGAQEAPHVETTGALAMCCSREEMQFW